MNTDVLIGILIPFVGTALGSACVFFMKKQLGDKPRYKEIIEKLPHLKKETDKKSNSLIVVDKGFM